jgi:hypothetical protein
MTASGLKYLVIYSAYGATLDMDALLAVAQPRRAHEVWHVGDGRAVGPVTKTAGVSVELGEFATPAEVIEVVRGWVGDEEAFLAAVARHAGPDVHSVLSCAMNVYAFLPTSIALPPELLMRLGKLRVEWAVTGYPTAGEEQSGDAPSYERPGT